MGAERGAKLMKKLALAFLILFGAISVQSDKAEANGATVVFLKVRYQDYFMTTAIRDKVFNSSYLYNHLEASSYELFVARVDPFVYSSAMYYTAIRGDYVVIPFERSQSVKFKYYELFDAMIGVTEDEQIIVLLPFTQQSPTTNYETSTPSLQDGID
jgi:hypothetical protein